MNASLKVLLVVLLLAPTVLCGVFRGWSGAIDDFEDHGDREEPVPEPSLFRDERPKRVEARYAQVHDEPSNPYVGQGDYEETAASNQGNSGYFGGFAPKAIVLHDDQSIEARFPFPAFPKLDFPFEGPL